jgi:hypothetical protein
MFLQERNGGICDSSSGVLVCEVRACIRRHISKGVLAKECDRVGVGGVRRLSKESTPYMCCCVGVGQFELPNFIISKHVILIDHMFSESGYPSHLTKYCSRHLLPKCRESRIFSTEYSSSPSINSGVGRVKLGLCIIVSR